MLPSSKAMLRAERTARLAAEADAQAQTLLIEKLRLTIRKLRHEQFGQSSERGALLDQLVLQLADLEANASQAETAAQMATGGKITVPSFERRKPARRPLPEQLPRERIVYPVPASCPCCGDNRLRKLGVAECHWGDRRDRSSASRRGPGSPTGRRRQWSAPPVRRARETKANSKSPHRRLFRLHRRCHAG
ncbi:MAG: hypothetical protein Q8N40_08065 [Bradyrhizobium sp.]|nr:hypothetical protein [Bradyrhizobium sp.]